MQVHTRQVNAMGQTAQKLAALRDRQARLQARIELLQNESRQQARKDDTRLKILIGAAMLSDGQRHPETNEFVRAVLGRAITLDRDRSFLRERKWL